MMHSTRGRSVIPLNVFFVPVWYIVAQQHWKQLSSSGITREEAIVNTDDNTGLRKANEASDTLSAMLMWKVCQDSDSKLEIDADGGGHQRSVTRDLVLRAMD